MKEKTRKRQKKTYEYIRAYAAKHGYAPSMREIQDAIGTGSTSTVHKDLRALESEGLLVAERAKPRAIQIIATEKPHRPSEEEDKQRLCNLLLPALQATRSLYDLADLKYNDDEGIVIATFGSGYTKKVNVTADSGIAMIKDILKHIV